MKKKILIVTSTFPRGETDVSSARFVFDLSQAMSAFYEVHVLAPHSPGAKRAEVLGKVKVHRFRYFRPEKAQGLTKEAGIMANIKKNKLLFLQLPFFFCSELLSVISIVKKEKINIINSHWMVPQGLTIAFVKRILNVKHVMTIHAAGIFSLKRWGGVGKKTASFIVRRSDLVLPVSSYIKNVLDELVTPGFNFRVLPMGVKSDFNAHQKKTFQEGKVQKREFKILFVGKLVEKKGLEYLLGALILLKDKAVLVKLTIAGGGPLEEKLKLFVLREGLAGNVYFTGWISNNKLPELYSVADITVVPSVYDSKGETEGMPVVILESLAMGTPVLGSRISGIPDIVEDGVNGWIVEYGDKQALSNKIEDIIKLDLEPFSRAAVETSLKYTYESIASGYAREIEKLFND